jgi:succinate dehydrogenase / fumarate reductase cytochrome b subunit
MNRLVRLLGASIGRKLVAATTGFMLIVFLIGHLFGNMKVFQGATSMNAYAAFLQGHPLLWVFRVGLLTVFVLHIWATLSLALENRAARPVAYHRYRPQAATFASRSMALSGVFLLLFVVYHLLHFTFGVIGPGGPEFTQAHDQLDVYAMVVQSFRSPWISVTYIVAMSILGLHLLHGAASAFQTFGVRHESYDALIKGISLTVVAVLALGNVAIALMILFGRVSLSGVN